MASQLLTSNEIPVDICFVREMNYVPEIDEWPYYTQDRCSTEIAAMTNEWNKKKSWIAKQLHPALVQGLSQWAQKEMLNYTSVSSLDSVLLLPIRCKSPYIVSEALVDTLPSHSPIVTRWLKVYIIYNSDLQQLLRVIITIRGELLE